MKRFQKGPARLRDGTEAEIYRLDGGGGFPIHAGVRWQGGVWSFQAFSADGLPPSGVDKDRALLPNAAPVVSDAALDAFYAAVDWVGVEISRPRDDADERWAAGLAAAFVVMLAEQERGE